ncbi:MAG: hypothetical protein RML32_00445, partial [Gammaproteobacteria bacterium]|nr:hypothetical protein [Gammaproteobacteria bacterium]
MAAVLLAACCGAVAARADGARNQWSAFGRDAFGAQASPLTLLRPDNVQRLRRVWVHRSGDV